MNYFFNYYDYVNIGGRDIRYCIFLKDLLVIWSWDFMVRLFMELSCGLLLDILLIR